MKKTNEKHGDENEKWLFEDYVFECFMDFLLQDENHLFDNGELLMKEEAEFTPDMVTNNSDIVCNKLWLDTVMRHLHNFNYN